MSKYTTLHFAATGNANVMEDGKSLCHCSSIEKAQKVWDALELNNRITIQTDLIKFYATAGSMANAEVEFAALKICLNLDTLENLLSKWYVVFWTCSDSWVKFILEAKSPREAIQNCQDGVGGGNWEVFPLQGHDWAPSITGAGPCYRVVVPDYRVEPEQDMPYGRGFPIMAKNGEIYAITNTKEKADNLVEALKNHSHALQSE